MESELIQKVLNKIDELGITPYQFGKLAGIKGTRHYAWLEGRAEPKHEDALLLEQWLNTNFGAMALKKGRNKLNRTPEILTDNQTDSNLVKAPAGRFPKKRTKESPVPFFNVDFLGGTDVEFVDDVDTIKSTYTMDIPEFGGCTAFRIYGISMQPLIRAGSILFGTKEASWLDGVEYGQIFGIVQKNNAQRLLKYVRRHPTKSDTHFILRSENPDFDDMEFPKENVKAMWLIHGWINKRT